MSASRCPRLLAAGFSWQADACLNRKGPANQDRGFSSAFWRIQGFLTPKCAASRGRPGHRTDPL